MRKKHDWKFAAGIVGSVAVFGIAVGLFVGGMTQMQGRAKREGADTLRKSIVRASVQCYAIEGRYPPSIEYLEDNYGVQIDRELYNVFYSGFASNLMPDITVLQRNELH